MPVYLGPRCKMYFLPVVTIKKFKTAILGEVTQLHMFTLRLKLLRQSPPLGLVAQGGGKEKSSRLLSTKGEDKQCRRPERAEEKPTSHRLHSSSQYALSASSSPGTLPSAFNELAIPFKSHHAHKEDEHYYYCLYFIDEEPRLRRLNHPPEVTPLVRCRQNSLSHPGVPGFSSACSHAKTVSSSSSDQ